VSNGVNRAKWIQQSNLYLTQQGIPVADWQVVKKDGTVIDFKKD
jgi:hypothetical protein